MKRLLALTLILAAVPASGAEPKHKLPTIDELCRAGYREVLQVDARCQVTRQSYLKAVYTQRRDQEAGRRAATRAKSQPSQSRTRNDNYPQ